MTRLALICDFREEGWHSMNLVADQLFAQLRRLSDELAPSQIRPAMIPYASRLSGASGKRLWNVDRLVNRFWKYPAHVRRLRGNYDVFHLVDHSYSHLVHELPAQSTIVTCHDLDTFRSVIDPRSEPRSWVFKRMTERILEGFRKAAHVICVSETTREELLKFGIIPAARTSVIHNGINPVFCDQPDADSANRLAELLGPCNGHELLHVGSTIARKRIDLLLEIFARVRAEDSSVRLVRAGGSLTAQQWRRAEALGVAGAITELPYLSESVLAALYRRSALVLQPSESEGFGLPVAEALACGAAVVATDLPVLREIGGKAVFYCPLGAHDAWRQSICSLLEVRRGDAALWSRIRGRAVQQSAAFAWEGAARRILDVYQSLS